MTVIKYHPVEIIHMDGMKLSEVIIWLSMKMSIMKKNLKNI